MKLHPRALAYAAAAVWGGSVLLIGLTNLSSPGYGRDFLEMLASVYPGYKADRTLEDVIVGTGYALFDGAVTGWLYNRLAK